MIEKYPMGMPDHLMSNRRLPLSACSAVGHQPPGHFVIFLDFAETQEGLVS